MVHTGGFVYHSQSSPEDRTLYADPNAIPHEVVPTTGDEYAVVDIGNKKKKKKQPDTSLNQVILLRVFLSILIVHNSFL